MATTDAWILFDEDTLDVAARCWGRSRSGNRHTGEAINE